MLPDVVNRWNRSLLRVEVLCSGATSDHYLCYLSLILIGHLVREEKSEKKNKVREFVELGEYPNNVLLKFWSHLKFLSVSSNIGDARSELNSRGKWQT